MAFFGFRRWVSICIRGVQSQQRQGEEEEESFWEKGPRKWSSLRHVQCLKKREQNFLKIEKISCKTNV